MSNSNNLSLFKRELARLVKKHSAHLSEAQLLTTLQDYSRALAENLAHRAPGPESELAEESVSLLQENPARTMPLGGPSTDSSVSQSTNRRAALLADLKARRARRHGRPAPLPPTQTRKPSAVPAAPGAAVLQVPQSSEEPLDPKKALELFARVRKTHLTPRSPAVEQFEAQAVGMLFIRRHDFALDINALPLSMEEQLLLDFELRETRSFESLITRSMLSPTQATAALAAFTAVGLVELQLPGLSEARSSTGTELRREAIRRVKAMEHRLKNYNAFGIAGLHWTTYDEEIARRFKLLRTHFDHLNQPMGIAAEYGDRHKAIREQLAIIYETLTNPRARRELRQQTVPPTDLLQTARALETIATRALRQNAPRRALDAFQRLLELDPEHPNASRLLPSLLASVSYR